MPFLMKIFRIPAATMSVSLGLLSLTLPVPAQSGPSTEGGDEFDPEFSADVDVFNDHIVTLASPWMEGRLPGTRGMELAKEYMEFYFKKAGLEAPWDGTFRQPFELAPRAELVDAALSFAGNDLELESDFMALAVGSGGSIVAPAVFVGYSLRPSRDEDDYESYEEGDDLSGKIAVLFRLEPMTEEGETALGDERWSGRASYYQKLREAAKRGAVGIIMVNPPGANHDGTDSLLAFRGSGGGLEIPVMHASVDAGERLFAEMDPEGRSALELRKLADAGRVMIDLEGEIEMSVEMEIDKMIAENVGALLPGKGELASELIVIGAHLDHLGMGDFGSRGAESERGRVLHPGADDNASGSAAILMIAERMAEDYANLGDDEEARSVLFVGFSAEESGLNGSRYYVKNPLVPLEDHVLMVNFDMIGRIKDKRLSLSGAKTGKGMDEFLAPIFENCELDLVQPEGMSGASDHSSFYSKNIPVLFGIIADFHGDYHTPRDVTSKINRIDSVNVVHLFHEIGMAMATHGERFEFQRMRNPRRTAQRPREPKVRFGVRLADSSEDPEPGLLIASVTAGSSADEGGVKVDDRILSWNDEKIRSFQAWMRMLADHEPGDVVHFEVQRGTETLVLKAILKAQ